VNKSLRLSLLLLLVVEASSSHGHPELRGLTLIHLLRGTLRPITFAALVQPIANLTVPLLACDTWKHASRRVSELSCV